MGQKLICSKCEKKAGMLNKAFYVTIKGEVYCPVCSNQLVSEVTSKIIATTTDNIDGYKVDKYLGIESVEIVIGTGAISEFGSSLADLFGMRSTAFEQKLQTAKQIAFKKLKYKAFELNGNAIIGVDLDYTEFSSDRIGLIANGTIVLVSPKE